MCLLLNYVSQIQSYWREVVNASASVSSIIDTSIQTIMVMGGVYISRMHS